MLRDTTQRVLQSIYSYCLEDDDIRLHGCARRLPSGTGAPVRLGHAREGGLDVHTAASPCGLLAVRAGNPPAHGDIVG